MTMADVFDEDRRKCKDCGFYFKDEALSDEQCFNCWVKEFEEQGEDVIMTDEEMENIWEEYIMGGID
jgi:hypothetical protein